MKAGFKIYAEYKTLFCRMKEKKNILDESSSEHQHFDFYGCLHCLCSTNFPECVWTVRFRTVFDVTYFVSRDAGS